MTTNQSQITLITKDNENTLNTNTRLIYDIAKRVYQQLGTGHTEFIYHRAMEIEFRTRQINYETEKQVVVSYNDINGKTYSLGEERIDILLDNCIIELKSIINLQKENELSQVNKYKRELDKQSDRYKYGIIINFPQSGTKPAKEEIEFIEIIF